MIYPQRKSGSPSPMHFVEKFDINLKFGICKVLSGPELAKFLCG